ncbi:PaaI family thioesterase [Psychrobacillus sp. NPDC093180]|uniref:PaaI family thioesterase n=1 Tax=Psychrobacillus sp. NPDC093180 TaxID=3364489 RepID=UPI003817D7BA
MESNKIEQINMIQDKLKNLNDDELNQISYLLSLYQASSTEQAETKIPMHFLGRFLGIEQKDDGTTEMKLGIQNENTYGVAQGGSIYTLADVAIGFQILKSLEEGEKVFTLELKVNFIKKGQGARLIAIPSILYQGKTTVVSECDIKDDTGILIAKALGTFYIVR